MARDETTTDTMDENLDDTATDATDGAFDDELAPMDAGSVDVGSVDVVELVMADHRKVEQLFEQLEQADADEREALVEDLVTSLRIHMEVEEQLLYPVVASEVDEEVAEEAEAEHELARQGVDALLALTPDEPGFDGALAMLKAGILHHVTEEEQEALPRLRDELPDEERMELGREVTELMTDLRAAGEAGTDRSPGTKHGDPKKGKHAKNGSAKNGSAENGKRNGTTRRGGKRAPNGKAGSDSTSEEPTKDELLAEAREQGISGTSKMNKAELMEALGKA